MPRQAVIKAALCAEVARMTDESSQGEGRSSQKPRLGRDVYLALAAIGWADGELDQEEADAIVRTALEEGLELDEIAEIEAATKEPLDIGVVDRKHLSKEDRLFVYAVASWMTRLDGVVESAELDALGKLGDALKVPERPREHADAIAQEVADLSEDDRPARYDLVALRRIIGERLREAQTRRPSGRTRAPSRVPRG
jgi:uncharacterized membrane protein YebE (DUF533 family)